MPILTFLASPIARIIGIALVVLAIVWGIYSAGQNSIQVKWDLEKAVIAAEIAKLKEESGKITTVEVVKYVDRIKTVQGKTQVITKYVDKYITVESDKNCVIPENVITILDAASQNLTIKGDAK